MRLTRRDFIAAAGAAAIPLSAQAKRDRHALADQVLQLAKKAGATYADIRISRYDNQDVRTRERQVQSVSSDSSYGYGIRVLKKGSWGFAASNDFREDSVAGCVARAIEIAEANAAIQTTPVKLAPEKAYEAEWKSAYEIDPFTVDLDKKVDLLLKTNEAALGVKGVAFVNSSLSFVREDKFFASSLGSRIQQDIVRSDGTFQVTAVDRAKGDSQSRMSLAQPIQRGWEAIEEYPFIAEAEQAGEEAVQKLKAKAAEPGSYDLLLHPSHLFLTIHESCGHPDRARPRAGLRGQLRGHELPHARQARQVPLRLEVGEHGRRPHAAVRALHGRLRRRRRPGATLARHQRRRVRRLSNHARAGRAGRRRQTARLRSRRQLVKRRLSAHAERFPRSR